MAFARATLNAILAKHRPDLHGRATFERIPTGKFNLSYWIYTPAETFVLRLAPPRDAVFVFYEREMMRQEPAIHTLVREKTAVPVAQVHAFDDSQMLVERDYILMECLPGRPLSDARRVNYEQVMAQIGEQLAQVHRLHADQYGYLGAHRPMEPQPRWADAVQVIWHKLIDDIVAVGFYADAESYRLRSLLDRYRPLFDRDVPASLLHMDVWHQNILVDADGTVTGLLDWDRALWEDPEIEFAVLDYCGVSTPAFWEGYGRARNLSPEARIRQVFYLLYELQKYIVIRAGRNGDPAGARRYKDQTLVIVRQNLSGNGA